MAGGRPARRRLDVPRAALVGEGQPARAAGPTAASSLAILVYAAHNAVGAFVGYAGGHWIDRAGPRVVFATGAALYVLAYAGFAAGSRSWWVLLIFFCLAGAGIGCAETAESALVAPLLPDRLRGSGFGVLGAAQAAGDVVATVVVGVLCTAVSPAAGFVCAAGWILLSVLGAGAFASGRPAGSPPRKTGARRDISAPLLERRSEYTASRGYDRKCGRLTRLARDLADVQARADGAHEEPQVKPRRLRGGRCDDVLRDTQRGGCPS
ncbi:MFS transporter [Streptomyces sp. NPDC088725]|uniref:MFS transporter n=1 Tax=Streptomyces sp. NPDC088725 TaxID=3365873 RepID=UPI00380AB96F